MLSKSLEVCGVVRALGYPHYPSSVHGVEQQITRVFPAAIATAVRHNISCDLHAEPNVYCEVMLSLSTGDFCECEHVDEER